MRWRRLLGADTPHEVGQRTPEVPLFDRDTPRMETTPARPFVCRVVSSSERGMTYTVEVDEHMNALINGHAPAQITHMNAPGRGGLVIFANTASEWVTSRD